MVGEMNAHSCCESSAERPLAESETIARRWTGLVVSSATSGMCGLAQTLAGPVSRYEPSTKRTRWLGRNPSRGPCQGRTAAAVRQASVALSTTPGAHFTGVRLPVSAEVLGPHGEAGRSRVGSGGMHDHRVTDRLVVARARVGIAHRLSEFRG